MRYYTVSDPHGHFSLMKKALKESGYFSDDSQKKLIICGDLFDRGGEAIEMQNFIVDLLSRNEVILIRGNHELLIEKLAEDLPFYTAGDYRFNHHFLNGTFSTAFQLTGFKEDGLEVYPKRLALALKNTPLFKKILPACVNYFETDKFVFVHGYIPCFAKKSPLGYYGYKYLPDWRNALQKDWDDAVWYNGMEASRADLYNVTEPNKTIICGHYKASYGHSTLENKGRESGENADYTPYYGNGIIAIDACTVQSGFVNCIVLED
ncbi:MAG: metallophosphoesterase [Clostridia bacterium]|nr:metallophosphoesterase [Clostridia bacterium]